VAIRHSRAHVSTEGLGKSTFPGTFNHRQLQKGRGIMAHLKRGIVLLAVLSVFASPSLVLGQSDRGTITGTVTDPTGAVIAGATVTATNIETAVSTQTKTTSAGDYTIPLLFAGRYDVTVEHPGLKKFVQTVVLEVGQTIRVNAAMQIGQSTQTVQVSSQGMLQVDTSNLATVVTSRDVQELPIVSQQEQRNPGFYMTLAPGVTGRGTANPTASGSGRQLNTTVNGAARVAAPNSISMEQSLVMATCWPAIFASFPFLRMPWGSLML
jgi:hypothetical protein